MFFGNYGDVTSRLPMIRKDQKAKVRKPISSSKLIYIYLLSFTDLTLVPIACHHMLLLLAVLMHCKFLYIPQILQHVMCFFVCLFVSYSLGLKKKKSVVDQKPKYPFLRTLLKDNIMTEARIVPDLSGLTCIIDPCREGCVSIFTRQTNFRLSC